MPFDPVPLPPKEERFLRALRDELSARHSWCQRTYQHGNARCLVAAMARVYVMFHPVESVCAWRFDKVDVVVVWKNNPDLSVIGERLLRNLPLSHRLTQTLSLRRFRKISSRLIGFNDSYRTTHRDVLRLIDAAIAQLEMERVGV